ncbi:MAG: sulfatase-like hydrolase/transferase, partial [Verrucomicrobiota bacterium]
GQVLRKLEEHQLRDNTITIFMSDNGHSEEIGNKIRVDNHKSGLPKDHFYGASGGGSAGKWSGQKGTFLEGGVRVPAIISYPNKLPKGEVRDQLITAMDWFPTVLELCDIENSEEAPKIDGYNILPIIESKDAESQYKGVMHFAWGTQWAVRDGDWKLIGRSNNENRSLHRLSDKNPEEKNYAAEEPEIVERLTKLHNEWAEEVKP